MNNASTSALSAQGVSIWLDDLSRDRLESGNLSSLIAEFNVVGVTTNPTIFANAIGSGDGYSSRVAECRDAGMTAEEIALELACRDVAEACDLLAEVYERSDGVDGRVSIEVSPALAHDAAGTVAQARDLWQRVNRPNAMIKIPATIAGLEAIPAVLAEGISVNVTLIFGLPRYREVINAYLVGLERARDAGHDLRTLHSVASFFISRVDSLVDPQLDALESSEARDLKGRAGIANARLAYEIAEQSFSSERARMLLASGAHPQRLLWASTGVKDPSLPALLYVTELTAPNVVNTMPEATLLAVAQQEEAFADRVTGSAREADQVWNSLDACGIDYSASVEQLETEGLAKFEASWTELLDTIAGSIQR